MAFETLPLILPGDIPDGADWEAYRDGILELRPVTAIKAGNTDRINNTRSADPHLTIALDASVTYDYDMKLYISSAADAAGDFAGELQFPATATLHTGGHGPADTLATGTIANVAAGYYGQNDSSSPSSAFSYGASLAGVSVHVWGRIVMGVTAGNLLLSWAQQNTNANFTRLHIGSTLTARKVV